MIKDLNLNHFISRISQVRHELVTDIKTLRKSTIWSNVKTCELLCNVTWYLAPSNTDRETRSKVNLQHHKLQALSSSVMLSI